MEQASVIEQHDKRLVTKEATPYVDIGRKIEYTRNIRTCCQGWQGNGVHKHNCEIYLPICKLTYAGSYDPFQKLNIGTGSAQAKEHLQSNYGTHLHY